MLALGAGAVRWTLCRSQFDLDHEACSCHIVPTKRVGFRLVSDLANLIVVQIPYLWRVDSSPVLAPVKPPIWQNLFELVAGRFAYWRHGDGCRRRFPVIGCHRPRHWDPFHPLLGLLLGRHFNRSFDLLPKVVDHKLSTWAGMN